jgi:hypothetical protein
VRSFFHRCSMNLKKRRSAERLCTDHCKLTGFRSGFSDPPIAMRRGLASSGTVRSKLTHSKPLFSADVTRLRHHVNRM